MRLPEIDFKNKRMLMLGGSAAVFVGLAVGLELLPMLSKDKPAADTDGGFAAWPLQPKLPPPAPESAELPAADAAKSPGYAKLLALFEQNKDAPAAKEFSEEFKKNPELEKAWDDYKDDQQSDTPQESVDDLAQNLASKSEFRQLVSKFAQDPGFRQVALSFTQAPEIKSAMQRLLARGDASTSASARSRSALLRSLAGGGGNLSSSRASFAPDFAQAGAPPGAPSAASSGSGASTALGGKTNLGGGSSSDAPQNANQPQSQNQPNDGGGYNVSASLGPIGDTGSAQSLGDAITHLCYPPDGTTITADQCSALETASQTYGWNWGACVMADLLDTCISVCEATPSLQSQCSPPPTCTQACSSLSSNFVDQCDAKCGTQKTKSSLPMIGYRWVTKGKTTVPEPDEVPVVQLYFKAMIAANGHVNKAARIVTSELRSGKYKTKQKREDTDTKGITIPPNWVGGMIQRLAYCPEAVEKKYLRSYDKLPKPNRTMFKPIVPPDICQKVFELPWRP